MSHPYIYQEYPKEHQEDLLKEAKINRELQQKGSRKGNRLSLANLLVSKVEDLLVSASARLRGRRVSPFDGKFTEA